MVQNDKKFCLSHSVSQEPYLRMFFQKSDFFGYKKIKEVQKDERFKYTGNLIRKNLLPKSFC